MAQHFLLTAKSKTISEKQVARMSEEEAIVTFEKLRWSDTDGEPVCATCGCTDSYVINTTSKSGKPIRRYKCKDSFYIIPPFLEAPILLLLP